MGGFFLMHWAIVGYNFCGVFVPSADNTDRQKADILINLTLFYVELSATVGKSNYLRFLNFLFGCSDV